jgi:N-acetylmuramic acid 6-phosphate etherase
MSTEDINPRSLDLEVWGNVEALKALVQGQMAAVTAIDPALPAIAAAVDDAVPRLRRGGRLVYVGAGTSGRIGVQDGAELTPTFNWPREQLAFVMAGGDGALVRSVEGAEDSDSGAGRMDELGVGADDVVIGVAASGRTPFTVDAVRRARERGAMTMGLANNAGAPLLQASEHPILIDTGPEPIAGSTRLQAGTAQKVVLNLFSTLTMVRLGRVYRGMMVDMRPTNVKLRQRAVRIVAAIAGCAEDAAVAALARADGDVKLAALLARGVDDAEAKAALAKHEGNLRLAIAELG